MIESYDLRWCKTHFSHAPDIWPDGQVVRDLCEWVRVVGEDPPYPCEIVNGSIMLFPTEAHRRWFDAEILEARGGEVRHSTLS